MKKKVLFVISTMNIGGAEIQQLRLLENLDYSKYDAHLFILSNNQKLKNDIPKEVVTETVRIRKNLFYVLFDVFNFILKIKRLSPDIIHSSLLLSNLLVRPYKILNKRVNILNHIHGQGNWIPKPIRFIDSKTSFLVDKFIFVSRFSADLRLQREKYSKNKINILYNAINTETLTDIHNEVDEKLVLGTLSRLTEVKKLERAIIITKYLIDNGVNVELKIAGDGEDMDKLKKTVNSLNLNEFVHFLGFKSDIPDFFSQINILLSTSEREDMPINLIEGLIAGKPLIATNVGGVSEIIKDEVVGLLIDTNIDDELNNILVFINNLNYQKAELINRRVGVNKFDINNYMNNLYKLYLK